MTLVCNRRRKHEKRRGEEEKRRRGEEEKRRRGEEEKRRRGEEEKRRSGARRCASYPTCAKASELSSFLPPLISFLAHTSNYSYFPTYFVVYCNVLFYILMLFKKKKRACV
jgi:hypothetical protein